MRLQRFLVQKVLNNVDPHISSTAFAPKCNIIKAVEPHLGCQWLIKIDVSGFFESISELAVYRVFRSIGYQPLISFELARLCTRRPGMPSKSRQSKRWLVRSNKPMVISSYEPATEPDVREIARLKEKDASEDRVREDLSDILDGRVSDNLSRQGDLFSSSDDPIYQKYMSFDSEDELFSVDDFMDEDFLSSEEEIQPFVRRMGYLPQGAPTSPMLANLAVYGLDCELEELAAQFSLIYTRYADDMAFSTLNKNSLDRAIAKKFVAEVYRKFAHWGLRPNLSKTHIRGPGSRKMILGLLVNDDVVRLPKSYFDNLKMHFYYIRKNGPGAHATARGFASSLQLRHHVEGLIHHAIQVEPKRGQKWMAIHNSIKWPI
jgi:retron-type reverse transcriptase